MFHDWSRLFAAVDSGLLQGNGFLKIGNAFRFRQGEKCLRLAFLRCLSKINDKIGDVGIGFKLIRFPGVKPAELQRLVKPLGSRWRKGTQFLPIIANSLTTNIDVPGQTQDRLSPDDLVIGIILVLRHRNPDLESPVIIVNLSRHLCFRIPAQPVAFRSAPIEIDNLSAGTDRDLIIGMSFRRDQ